MNNVTLIFLAFLAGAAVLYYVVPKKIRWIVLLIASIGFYAVTDKYLIAFVCLTTISVYFGARGIQKNNDRLKKPAPLKEAQPAVAMSEKQDAQVSQETGDMAKRKLCVFACEKRAETQYIRLTCAAFVI